MSNFKEVPVAARWLGLAGLVPFVGFAALIWLLQVLENSNASFASMLLTGYGAVILSFMGGCRWGLAAAQLGEGPSVKMLGISVLPALYAWVVALLPDAVAQLLLALGLLLLLWADVNLTRNGGAPSWWAALRWPLSLGAAGSLVAGAIAGA